MTIPNTAMPYLPSYRSFPKEGDDEKLSSDLTKMYSELANTINSRIIGIFNQIQAVTGEQWLNTSNTLQPRQSYRSVYIVPAIAAGGTGTINHGLSGVTQFTRIWGTAVTAAPDNRPLPYASAAAVNQQIELKVTSTQIIIILGAASPNVTQGLCVLEYLLN